MPSRARLLTPYSRIWPVPELESRVILPLDKHKLLRVHLTAWLIAAEQSKIKTGAGKIKAGCSGESNRRGR